MSDSFSAILRCFFFYFFPFLRLLSSSFHLKNLCLSLIILLYYDQCYHVTYKCLYIFKLYLLNTNYYTSSTNTLNRNNTLFTTSGVPMRSILSAIYCSLSFSLTACRFNDITEKEPSRNISTRPILYLALFYPRSHIK